MARIAIVGAGPAGASAGYHLASRAHHVTLIDRAEFPRPKTCGDWLTHAAVVELARMGLGPPVLERVAFERAPVRASLFAAPNGRSSLVEHDPPSWCVPRHVLDHLLRERALAAGCRPLRREVRGHGRDGFLAGFDHVVDARGVYAGEANCVALRSYAWVPRGDVAALDERAVQLFADAEFRMGYGWVFPVHTEAGHVRFNLGVGLWREEGRRPGRKVTDYYDRFVRENPVARRLTGAAFRRERPRGHHLAAARRHNTVAGGGVLRIGDAANLTDPLTGEGIGNALRSGFLVALAIDRATDAFTAERAWQALYEREFVPEFRLALALRRLLVPTRGKNAATFLLRHWPALARRFHGALAGARPYADLLPFLPRGRAGAEAATRNPV
jgi:flavin-dependent dehydrogenase